jgi:aspartate-semialdehyde dehydrogenase
MGVSAGRLSEDSIFEFKFVGLSHNTFCGAAGGVVLITDLLKAEGYIQAK